MSCYRPISLLSAISKVFEKVVHKKLYRHITDHSLLSDKQSGYRQNHSTQQQLMYLTHNLYKSLDKCNNFTAIYLDISKYFDKIWHTGLLYKCKNEFGIQGRLLDWLQSYLKDRRQRVKIGDTFSTTETINAGCPQGSVLGPLLALIYLNGLSSKTQHDTTFFADDTSIYASYDTTNLQETQRTLQKDLDEIYNYGRAWAITFNTTKTVQQIFSHKHEHSTLALNFGGDPIPIHDCHTHLGLTFSNDLRFHEHINKICLKVNKTLSPIYPIAKYLTRPILDQIYKTYVRPHFDNCDAIYDGHITIKDATRLETLQNRAARLVTGGLFRTSTHELLTEIGWDRLKTRRQTHRLVLYHNLVTSEHQPDYITAIMPLTREQETRKSLRNSKEHTVVFNRTTSYKTSFFPNTIRQWNALPYEVQSLTHNTFKKRLRQRFGRPDPPDYYCMGTKWGNIQHARIRMNMTSLNCHLYVIQKVSSPECKCGHRNEDICHYILKCPNYKQQRQILFNEMSRILQTDFGKLKPRHQLNTLIYGVGLSGERGPKVASHFQNFLFSSKRFTHS